MKGAIECFSVKKCHAHAATANMPRKLMRNKFFVSRRAFVPPMLPAESFNTILASEFLPVQRHWISPNITKKILVYKERRKASLSGVYLLNLCEEFFFTKDRYPQFTGFSFF